MGVYPSCEIYRFRFSVSRLENDGTGKEKNMVHLTADRMGVIWYKGREEAAKASGGAVRFKDRGAAFGYESFPLPGDAFDSLPPHTNGGFCKGKIPFVQ